MKRLFLVDKKKLLTACRNTTKGKQLEPLVQEHGRALGLMVTPWCIVSPSIFHKRMFGNRDSKREWCLIV